MKKVIFVTVLLICSYANAEGRFVLVDSYYINGKEMTYLSLDARDRRQNPPLFKGTIWSSKTAKFKKTTVSVDPKALKYIDNIKKITKGSQVRIKNRTYELQMHMREFQTGNLKLYRRAYVARDNESTHVISVNDDPWPLWGIGFAVGAAIAICVSDRIAMSMNNCENPWFKVGFSIKDGFTCESKCGN